MVIGLFVSDFTGALVDLPLAAPLRGVTIMS
jgi:hypothetical protein